MAVPHRRTCPITAPHDRLILRTTTSHYRRTCPFTAPHHQPTLRTTASHHRRTHRTTDPHDRSVLRITAPSRPVWPTVTALPIPPGRPAEAGPRSRSPGSRSRVRGLSLGLGVGLGLGLSRQMMAASPGRFLHPTKSCGRSKPHRAPMGPVTAVSTWRPRLGRRSSPRATVWWRSPGGWSTARSSPSTTTPVCAPRTNRWCRRWWPGRGFAVASGSGCSPPATQGAPPPRACTGACGATGFTWSPCGSSARRGCDCSPWNPAGSPVPQTSATSRSFARRRRTARVCSWQTRDSVTPRTRPISARVRFSK
ncbi:hypothetical protein SAMN05192558_102424 [Actinokineospora alba]|uniref:Uncharacterized protein n=1 Tax=Actinokineospora alba TaxID=504798 RepID=A0A1H0I5T0_9PSEU|nr:hypothetical protein SAMN05421871_108123 [Actinokineospora alba]SDO26824.1 hypothetical protein SAMN05192558_102424 [Actinokineospora alba]